VTGHDVAGEILFKVDDVISPLWQRQTMALSASRGAKSMMITGM